MSYDPVNVDDTTVAKIPIAGPAPYNTLVCCLSQVGGTLDATHVTRWRARTGSNYTLQGFDPTNPPPQFQHTTSGWIAAFGPGSKHDTWLYAVDDVVDAGFDPETGVFFVDVDFALMLPNIPSRFKNLPQPIGMAIIMCSYVLVEEPQPGRHGRIPRVPMSSHAGGPPAHTPVEHILSRHSHLITGKFRNAIRLMPRPGPEENKKGG
jgi:hypothetical protein